MENSDQLNEKSKSKTQQRLFGLVHSYQQGKLDLEELPDSLAKKIKSIAEGERKKTGDKRKFTKGISKEASKDYAKTKHTDLPEKVEENKIKRFADFLNENEQHIEGGQADNKTLEDIAAMHKVSVEYFYKILPDAIAIEHEHSDDDEIAKKIVLDHLTESPIYYSEKHGLPTMEENLEDIDKEETENIINDELGDKKIKKFDDFQ
jgi:hypothetical protein